MRTHRPKRKEKRARTDAPPSSAVLPMNFVSPTVVMVTSVKALIAPEQKKKGTPQPSTMRQDKAEHHNKHGKTYGCKRQT